MSAPQDEGTLGEDVILEGRVLTLDLAFLCNFLLRDGNEINMKVVKGLPDGAKTVAAGVTNNSLVIVFDRKVPSEIWFEDRTISIPEQGLN